jgi:hypothetical protein
MSRYRTNQVQTGKIRYKISRQCAGQEMSRYRTNRVQLKDRQNKVQDQQTMHRSGRFKVQDEQGPASRQAKQGTGSSDNVQDKRYRTSRVQLQDRQNKVQDLQTMCRIKGTGQAGFSYRTGKIRYSRQ